MKNSGEEKNAKDFKATHFQLAIIVTCCQSTDVSGTVVKSLSSNQTNFEYVSQRGRVDIWQYQLRSFKFGRYKIRYEGVWLKNQFKGQLYNDPSLNIYNKYIQYTHSVL